MKDRHAVRAGCFLACSLVAGFAGIYGLPFLFPNSHPAFSQSYVVGYNNRVAVASVVLISVLVALFSPRLLGGGAGEFTRSRAVPWPWLAGVLVLVAAWNGGLSWLVFTAHDYGVEDYYFLPQLEKVYYLHLHLYRDVEFAYGQLLFYPPVWFHWLLTPFHVSLRAAYYMAMVMNHLLGLAMLYFIVNRLPMPRHMRVAAFVSVALFSFNFALGPNYTLLRYMLPVFCFVLFSRIERPLAATGFVVVGQILIWMDSSEQAIAFCFSVVVYGCYRAWRQGPLWILPIAGAMVGTMLYLGVVDRSVLSSLIHMSGGAGNLVPQLSIEVPVLLIATVWLVPWLVACHVSRDTPLAGLLLGLYAFGLGLLPVSLGSSGIVRIAGASAVLFLLSLAAAAQRGLIIRGAWTAAISATYLLMVLRWYADAHHRFYPDVARVGRTAPLVAKMPPALASRFTAFEGRWGFEDPPLDVDLLHAAIGDAPFETPFAMPEIVEEKLPQLPNFVPSYFSGTINLWNGAVEQQKVDELRRVNYALLRGKPMRVPIDANWDVRFGIHTHYRAVHPMFEPGELPDELNQNWTPAGSIGKYLLYRRVR